VGGESYYEGLVTVPILLAGYLFLGVYYNFSVWFKLTDKTYYGTLITVGGAILTIVLNFALIPQWGYVGSSWASLACYFSMAIACYWIGQKYYPIPYKMMTGFGYILFAVALIYISSIVSIDGQIMSTGFHVVLMMIYVIVAYLLER
jgi:O-antigen/teichoic acid export membrane protein